MKNTQPQDQLTPEQVMGILLEGVRVVFAAHNPDKVLKELRQVLGDVAKEEDVEPAAIRRLFDETETERKGEKIMKRLEKDFIYGWHTPYTEGMCWEWSTRFFERRDDRWEEMEIVDYSPERLRQLAKAARVPIYFYSEPINKDLPDGGLDRYNPDGTCDSCVADEDPFGDIERAMGYQNIAFSLGEPSEMSREEIVAYLGVALPDYRENDISWLHFFADEPLLDWLKERLAMEKNPEGDGWNPILGFSDNPIKMWLGQGLHSLLRSYNAVIGAACLHGISPRYLVSAIPEELR